MNILKFFLFFILGVLMFQSRETLAAENMKVHVFRLVPGDDVKVKLENFVNETAKSTGESPLVLREKLGGSPTKICLRIHLTPVI